MHLMFPSNTRTATNRRNVNHQQSQFHFGLEKKGEKFICVCVSSEREGWMSNNERKRKEKKKKILAYFSVSLSSLLLFSLHTFYLLLLLIFYSSFPHPSIIYPFRPSPILPTPHFNFYPHDPVPPYLLLRLLAFVGRINRSSFN